MPAIDDRLSAAAKVERRLRRRIIDGTYLPNRDLPSERQLAKDFCTSRITVAAALRALERDGLVIRTKRKATRLLPASKRLTKPCVGVIHYEMAANEAAGLQGVLLTLQGIRDTLDRLGYEARPHGVPKAYRLSTARELTDFGALILVEDTFADQQVLGAFARRGTPIVAAKLETDVDVAATGVDHRQPTLRAVRTFVELGHRRIAFVGREPTYAFHGQARDAYLAALHDAGLEVDESLIAVCEKTDALSGYLAARSLLQSATPPTAIVAVRDAVAEGVCHAIKEAGKVVGHHVSVIGFDDSTWPEGRQFLTTFREPCYEMGVAAAEMLVERIVNGPTPPEKRLFETPFLLRRTAGPVFDPEVAIPRTS